jgi:hypothetical protein
MNRAPPEHGPVEPAGCDVGHGNTLFRVLFVLLAVDFCLVFIRPWCPGLLPENATWPERLLLALAVTSTLASLMHQLPVQTMLLAALGVGVGGVVMQSLGSWTGIPSALLQHAQGLEPDFSLSLALGAALIWIVVVLNSRGAAQLILRRQRGTSTYGLWLLGLSAVLVLVLAASLSPFLSRVMQPRDFDVTGLSGQELASLGLRIPGWTAAALLTLVWVAPVLIIKKPVAQVPSLQPLLIWLLGSALFLAGKSMDQLRRDAWLWLVLCAAITALALRGRAGGEAPVPGDTRL